MASSSISALNERLRSVAGRGNCEEIEQLLRLGAFFEEDQYGRTALHYAAHYGQAKALRLMAARGCDLHTEDTYGCTPLHKAVAPDGHVEAVRALIEEGCDVERHDLNGNTALHEAAWHGFSQTLDVLIRVGKANIHASNKNGQKPIHLACQNGHNQCTRLLLKAGTHPNIKNNSGETPLHTACLFGHMTCTRILLSAECESNAKNKDGDTPLHVAASLGKQKITKLLLEAQCDVKIRNKTNQTALDLARQNDHTDVLLLILGAQRTKKGKVPFFSRKKKRDEDGFSPGDSFHGTHHHRRGDGHHHRDDRHHHRDNAHHNGDSAHHHGDGAHYHEDGAHHKHGEGDKHKHTKKGDDDADGHGHGGLRVRGRREMETYEHRSSGSSRDRSKKKKKNKKKDDGEQKLFVRQEMKKKVESEKRHLEEIQAGREMGNPLFRAQPFKDKNGKIIHVPMPVQCNCTPYIKKLENQVEASKERLLHEIDMSKARFESRMNNMEKRMTHQAQCMDQLCKERIAAEKTECMHRIDRRAIEERKVLEAQQNAKAIVLRNQLKEWFESRIQPLHEQLSRTCLDDTALSGSVPARRGRPRAGLYKLRGRDVGVTRKRSKSESNISDLEEAEDDEEESSEEESDDDEEEGEKVERRMQPSVRDHRQSSRKPSQQSPSRHKTGQQTREKELAKTGAIPKKNRSSSFRLAVSDEDGHSAGSNSSGRHLSLVAGTYRPPLIDSHQQSPGDSQQSHQPDFELPLEETDDTDSSGSDSETASQLSLETVSYKPKSISGSTTISSSTRDSGHYTLKGSSVSSDRRSQAPTRANLIAYQALTVNARAPPPLPPPAQSYAPSGPLRTSSPRPYTPEFSPPVSPTSITSQPHTTTSVTPRGRQSDGAVTPVTEHTSSANPSPTDSSGKTPSTSSGISSGDAHSVTNPSPIKYNVISPHTGKSRPHTYNPRTSSSYQADLLKDVDGRNRTSGARGAAPPQYSQVYSHRIITAHGTYSRGQPHDRHASNANNNAAPSESRDQTDCYKNVPSIPSNYNHNKPYAGMLESAHQPLRPMNYDSHVGNASAVGAASKSVSVGNISSQTKSAASRLGVTPSLSGVRVSANQNTVQQVAPTGSQQIKSQSPYPESHRISIHSSTRIDGNATSGKGDTHSKPLSVQHGPAAQMQATRHSNNPVKVGNQSRTFSASSASSANSQSAHRNLNHPPNTRTAFNHTSGTTESATGSSTVKPMPTNGTYSVGSGNIIGDVEHFNKTATPEHKLKYTREIIL